MFEGVLNLRGLTLTHPRDSAVEQKGVYENLHIEPSAKAIIDNAILSARQGVIELNPYLGKAPKRLHAALTAINGESDALEGIETPVVETTVLEGLALGQGLINAYHSLQWDKKLVDESPRNRDLIRMSEEQRKALMALQGVHALHLRLLGNDGVVRPHASQEPAVEDMFIQMDQTITDANLHFIRRKPIDVKPFQKLLHGQPDIQFLRPSYYFVNTVASMYQAGGRDPQEAFKTIALNPPHTLEELRHPHIFVGKNRA